MAYGTPGRPFQPPDTFPQPEGKPKAPGLETLMRNQVSSKPDTTLDSHMTPEPPNVTPEPPKVTPEPPNITPGPHGTASTSHAEEPSGTRSATPSLQTTASSVASDHVPDFDYDSTYESASDDESDGDTEMADATSNFGANPDTTGLYSTNETQDQHGDVLGRIGNWFRLLDLVDEHGSGGIVEKVVIDQASLHRFLNLVRPGSYDSVSKIKIKSLDKLSIKPVGIYGDRAEIIKFLQDMGCLDAKSAALLSQLSSEASEDAVPVLRSGLYLALDQGREVQGSTKHAYIVYWPEDTTWDDQVASSSVRRNRVTFMRYLTKLADQKISLVSHSQARAFVWDARAHNKDLPEDQQEHDDDARLFSFEVAKSLEQEEDAIASPGFMVQADARHLPGNGANMRVDVVSGEEKAALLVSSSEEARIDREQVSSQSTSQMALQKMIKSTSVPLQLGNMSPESLELLGKNGLREKFKGLFGAYDQKIRAAEQSLSKSKAEDRRSIDHRLYSDRWKLEVQVRNIIRSVFDGIFPSINVEFDKSINTETSDLLYNHYPGLHNTAEVIRQKHNWTAVGNPTFRNLKRKWFIIRAHLESNSELSEREQHAIVDRVLKGDERLPGANHSDEGQSNEYSSWFTYAAAATARVVTRRVSASGSTSQSSRGVNKPLPHLSDSEFVALLQPLEQLYPSLHGITSRIYDCLWDELKFVENALLQAQTSEIISAERHSQYKAATKAREPAISNEKRVAFNSLMDALKEAMASESRNSICVDSVRQAQYGSQFYWSGTRINAMPAQNRYKIYPLELTEQDSQSCRTDEAHVPQPKLDTKHMFEFATAINRTVEFTQLVRDKCIVVVSEPGQTRIYVEDNVSLDQSINRNNGKVTLNHHSLGGPGCMFAFDQATRLFAIVHGQKDIKLSIFIFDEHFANLRSRGSPIPIHRWYDTPVELVKVCFVSGVEEVCLIEKSGRARIFSLVTQQFRNAHLQIACPIVNAFSAPDGSCLFVATRNEQSSSTSDRLIAFHWASFGPNSRGIDSTELPVSDAYRVATRFEGRGRTHVISFDADSRTIRSTVLQIKQKATEFSFRSDREGVRKAAAETSNNSLIDCHLEVWTRFPVMPAVSRNTLCPIRRCPPTITFLSPFSLNQLKEYFAGMIATFEQTTRKPMGGSLSAIVVESTDQLQHGWEDSISEFQLGSFIVELLCLIPLHLAITRENRFIPLKDGVWDPKYEQTLLGADVPAIIDALSLGWYESLFQSYMATKPVRVVSSMGEQSVGKSYCLNHFADTSFAGSAMRTTEGVWLSCTPTEDYLLVSLDFEGVHSIERSAQEDALLVLFNTAISNLVLFRNNFAISRDIAGLFTSFQSSAMVLDPNANRGLFNSTLAIIIKDVTNADANDIVREFSLKFQRIVEKEQDQNFISRLHRGRIQIIPWPVINSPNFYSLFLRLRQQLDKQKFTHGSAGAFLHNLKTLMAKIKASDWGALDQNLATHRAQQLIERLPSALCYGRIDEGPLKNMDTDEEVPTPDKMLTFFVPEFGGGDSNGNEMQAERALKALVQDCTTISRFQPPATDAQYVEDLQHFINRALDQRLALVQQWIAVNVDRFPVGNQDIRNVTARVNSAALAMRAAVRICSSRCADCLLLCLHTRGHTGGHTCGTDHSCVFDCEVAEGHVQNEPCGLPAGHGGKHMCNVKAHSCGEECHLSQMGGCDQSCTKPMFHEGEHICSARSHLCGKSCDLRNAKQGRKHGVYSCPGACNVPWDEPHERHTCDNARACPMECSLCLRLCSNTDHFHGLESDATHLCGQEHICTSLCGADGICQIETRPSAIQEQFAGRHESFMYTRYTQVDRRLSCVIPIPPGALTHDGVHTHDTAADVFHFCDARCPNCEYLCTLPLGHPQQLHETSHGSMITTQWVVEGDDANPGYELDGRRFGSGDEGAPMLCNLVCSAQGRHAHIDYCRSVDPDGCNDRDCEHIPTRMHPEPGRPKDWISHATHWARSGFRDPYSQDEQVEFAKCDVFCAGPEHEATATSPENPSRCILPIFHAPLPPRPAPPTGHVSIDGHHFDCQNPSRLHQSYHIVLVIDSSGSMGCQDHQPLPNTPVSAQLVARCNNRYGAVLSALYGFWLSRENVMVASANQARQDAYSVVTFDHNSETRVENDFTSTTDQLVDQLIAEMDDGGTNFHGALARAQAVIEANWSSDRAPVIVFLSDGEARLDDNPVYDLCQMCVGRGKPLAFYSVSFGTDTYSASLRRMAEIGREVYATAPQDVLTTVRGNPCAYAVAIDSITLADTFLGIANSLQKPRASLISQHAGRRAIF